MEEHLEALIGIRYGTPAAPPKVTQAYAIQVATQQLGVRVEQATMVQAKYVLISDDNNYVEDEQGNNHFATRDVPAWVVTFTGIQFPLRGGGRGERGRPARYNHEVHIVIDAETGTYLRLFTFR